MFHFSKLTSALAAAVLMVGISTGVASAVTLLPGPTSIIGNEEYDYQSFFPRSAVGSTLTFTLKALEALTLGGEGDFLQLSGKFVGLSVKFDGFTLTALPPASPLSTTAVYLIGPTAFLSGDVKSLVISWTKIIKPAGSTPTGKAQIQLQLVTSTVPVPAAGLMLVSALGGIGALRRRARKA